MGLVTRVTVIATVLSAQKLLIYDVTKGASLAKETIFVV